eukprot:scaffold8024_cov61-Phaeocystis_antarctica.AAC.1
MLVCSHISPITYHPQCGVRPRAPKLIPNSPEQGTGRSAVRPRQGLGQLVSPAHPLVGVVARGGSITPGNSVYGVRSRRTRLLEDQLGRADAGSWQIADGGATRKAAAGGTSVGDYRVRFVVEP